MPTQYEEKAQAITEQTDIQSTSENDCSDATEKQMIALLHKLRSRTFIPKQVFLQYLEQGGIEADKAEEIVQSHRMCTKCKVLPNPLNKWLRRYFTEEGQVMVMKLLVAAALMMLVLLGYIIKSLELVIGEVKKGV